MSDNESDLRILIADDSDLMRSGLCSLLKSHPGWTICGEAVDGRDAVEKAIDLRPDVILVDISMPYLNGFETARCIHEKLPDSEILIVTEHAARSLAHLPPQEGVRGYIVKSRLDRDLIASVEAASRHQPLGLSMAAR